MAGSAGDLGRGGAGGLLAFDAGATAAFPLAVRWARGLGGLCI